MLVTIGNKKIKILFYILIFILLSTISFFEKTNIFGNKFFFPLNKIEIYGYQKIDYVAMQDQLSGLIGKNLLFINSEDIKEILDKNKLISEFKIQKKYPDTININLREVNFVARIFRNKEKYFLADNNNLIPFKDYVADSNLPIIYGKNAEHYFNDFQRLLKLNNFNLNIISSYYFFQINRWDLITNNNKIIKFPSKGLKEAIKIANSLLNNKDFNKYSVIDLRINNKIITQ
jgi:cell division septal protein FtsQ